VSGLASGGLILSVTGAAVAVSSGTPSLRLASGLRSGTAYTVTVATQPSGQTCSVASGSGVITSANVSNVVVTCSAQAFALGGTISGLNVSGLKLANGADTLSVATGATTFTMPSIVAVNSSYDLMVSVQPSGAICAVNNGTGTMPAHALSDIAITCTDGPFTVGGSITGLGAYSALVLTNGSDTLRVNPSATGFTMPTAVLSGSQYSVQVLSSPAGLTCSTTNGAGTVGATNVTNISVTCSYVAYSVGGTISNLTASGLKLANGSDTLDVNSGANNFVMADLVAYTGAYNVTVLQNPTGETCTVAEGSGVMGTSGVTDVAITCSTITVTIAGTISGLGPNTGLVLLDNNGDATSISANATSFSMNTAVAYGSSYNLTVGTQPYGISLACTVSGGSGAANDSMSPITVNCAAVSSVTQSEVLGYFAYPVGLVLDANKNLFVADAYCSELREFPFNSGSYGSKPTILISGLSEPQGVTLDANGNLFIADSANGRILRLDYTNGSYGTTAVTVASGFQFTTGVGVDSSGNVFVSDPYAATVSEVAYSNGGYSPPSTIGSGFGSPTGLALDVAGNVFVADNNTSSILEIVNNGGSYGSVPATVGSGLNVPTDVAFDAHGNLFVADTHNNAIEEFSYGSGTYSATPDPLGSTWSNPQGVAVDASGNVFVADSVNRTVKELMLNNGSYQATPTLVGPGIAAPVGAAVDSSGNLFIADPGTGNVEEIAFNNGNYGGALIPLSAVPLQATSVALDSSGNLFVADSSHQALLEIAYSNGAYSTTPVTLGSGFGNILGLAVDSNRDVFVADTGNGVVEEYTYSNNSYSSTTTQVASGFNALAAIAVDSSGNLFVVDNDFPFAQLDEFIYSNGHYSSTPIVLTSAFSQIGGVVVDRNGNVFFGDRLGGTVLEFVLSNGSYSSSPITVSSGYSNIQYLALDSRGRVYAGDICDLKILTP
jgi:sugar lactone lactonase YvrE